MTPMVPSSSGDAGVPQLEGSGARGEMGLGRGLEKGAALSYCSGEGLEEKGT